MYGFHGRRGRGSGAKRPFSTLILHSLGDQLFRPQSCTAAKLNASYVETPWQVGQSGMGTLRQNASFKQDMQTHRSGSPALQVSTKRLVSTP